MIPVISRKETGIKLRKIMDEKGFTVKDVQEYLDLGSMYTSREHSRKNDCMRIM